MWFLMGEPTPEQEAEIKRRRDLHDMAHHDAVNATSALIESLDEEHLRTLKTLMFTTVGDERDSFAMHTIGFISSRLHEKFGVCLACGEKHTELDPADAMKEPASE